MLIPLTQPTEEFGQTWTHVDIRFAQLTDLPEGTSGVVFEFCLCNDAMTWPEVFRIVATNLEAEVAAGGPFLSLRQSLITAFFDLKSRAVREKARL